MDYIQLAIQFLILGLLLIYIVACCGTHAVLKESFPKTKSKDYELERPNKQAPRHFWGHWPNEGLYMSCIRTCTEEIAYAELLVKRSRINCLLEFRNKVWALLPCFIVSCVGHREQIELEFHSKLWYFNLNVEFHFFF